LARPRDQNVPGKTGEASAEPATPTGKRPRGRPRIRWRDNISDLACSRRGLEPAKLSEIAEKRVVFLSSRIADPTTLLRGKAGVEMNAGGWVCCPISDRTTGDSKVFKVALGK